MGRTVTITLSDDEYELFEKQAVLFNCGLSSVIKELAIEKLEDEYDLHIIDDYERRKRNGKLKLYSFDEMIKELGLEENH